MLMASFIAGVAVMFAAYTYVAVELARISLLRKLSLIPLAYVSTWCVAFCLLAGMDWIDTREFRLQTLDRLASATITGSEESIKWNAKQHRWIHSTTISGSQHGRDIRITVPRFCPQWWLLALVSTFVANAVIVFGSISAWVIVKYQRGRLRPGPVT